MFKKLVVVIFAVAVFALSGCGKENKTAPSSMLDEVSGVWKEQTGNGLMTIVYADKKVRMLFDDTFVPVTVGDIDETNRTVNFNVTVAATGKPGVWTVREIYNADKSAFHLQLTLHDGSQDDFGFVRKISNDDLNRIASLEVQPPKANSAATMAAAASTVEAQPEKVSAPATPVASVAPVAVEPASTPVPTPAPTEPQAVDASPAPAATQPTAFAPSFDCAKVSGGPERLICGSSQLSALDVELGQAYKRLMSETPDKAALKAEQVEWRKKERDACSTADCVAQAYRSRIDELDAASAYLSKPAQFK